MIRKLVCSMIVALIAHSAASAQDSVHKITGTVNKKMVKLFGIGGFKGLPSYGSGVLVSEKGHILTVNNHILNTPGLLVHLYDGRVYQATVLAREPELDVALLKLDEDAAVFLPHYKLDKETAAKPLVETGDWILAFSNQFRIALRDEPMSVQRGVIMTVADLRGRRGVFDAQYQGDAYFLDVIACNPGAAGGALTNRKGDLLGILGRELKSSVTDTWINYAIPLQATVEVEREDKETKKVTTTKESIASFVEKALTGKYEAASRPKREDKGAYHGIIFVANELNTTPPYVEEVVIGSPGHKSGLLPDDLILYVDGESVPTIKAFRDAVKYRDVGTEVRLDYQRGNKLLSAKVILAKPAN